MLFELGRVASNVVRHAAWLCIFDVTLSLRLIRAPDADEDMIFARYSQKKSTMSAERDSSQSANYYYSGKSIQRIYGVNTLPSVPLLQLRRT